MTDEEKMTIADALAHNTQVGGSRIISYDGMELLAPLRDIKESIDFLNNNDRRKVMASVNATLARRFREVKKGTASQKIAMECMQDIAIWFANEIIEGRETLEIN